MEYLDNGDLAQLYYRTIKYDLVVPNRVLWSILLCRKLCLIRRRFEFVC